MARALFTLTIGAFAGTSIASGTEHNPLKFKEFLRDYNKVYSSDEEYASAMLAFFESVDEIARLSELNPQATFGLNADADVSADVWRKSKTGYVPTSPIPSGASTAPVASSTLDVGRLPVSKIDWRDEGAVDPTIFDQGECGCCWAISVAQTVGSQYFLKANMTEVPSLSFQQLICCDCGNDDAGCHGGDPHEAYDYIIEAGGLEADEDYPFTDSGPNAQSCNLLGECGGCRFNENKVAATMSGYETVTQTNPVNGNPGDEDVLAKRLASDGPISVCIDSDPWRFYLGGILDYGDRVLNHCVQLIGYDASYSTPYWILKNSWGETWGEKGYIRMMMGMDICGVADVATIPTI